MKEGCTLPLLAERQIECRLTGGGLAAAVEWDWFVGTDRRFRLWVSKENDKSFHLALTGPDSPSVLPSATAAC